ncbi:hypothetical protein BGX38DRAFT_1249062 [Terfezia claveryi]|nr:hypothetical protein BGX38DRAFT_1249062 [Terfezia claveryi]
MAPGGGGNIKVVVRCRPFNSREKERCATCIVKMEGSQTVLTPPPGMMEKGGKGAKAALEESKIFNFDRSYWSFDRNDPHYAGQDNLFQDLGGPLLDNAFEGYNNCIFAYGQTGSGKSYSMMGYGEEHGVIPKICQHMFERIKNVQTKDLHTKCTVEVSYLEIYNERVRDLLNPSTKGNLKVREHPSLGPYVEDLAKLVVGSFQEIEHLMDEGNKARTVAATNMNATSSRSHAVFTLILSQKRHDIETGFDTEKVSRISLVDLAGSERANSTGATGARLKEGAEINRSLSTLGRVIAALAELSSAKGKKAKPQVPYRDSVLTWLLKDSLGGNSMTAMIAAISPADINWDETLSTLRYADSAKRIKNHAVVNEDPNAKMIRELKEELEQLRAKLSGGAGSLPEENYAPDVPLEKQIVTITAPDGTVKKVSKAEIAEQLQSSEKLLTEIKTTWEERLEKTQQIHKEREQALEELGISIEKGSVGISTPKKIPHLVNLSDDPLLAECLVYNIKPGTTTVGNQDTSNAAQIRLNGSKILGEHCRFENHDDVVTLIPSEGAAVMVNGLRIEEPRRLRTGYRIILGDFHIFRFNHPQEARAERDRLRQSVTASQLGSPDARHHHHSLSQDVVMERAETDADSSRPDSPAPVPSNARDIDWSFARREAAGAWLGDTKIATLSDDELDNLLEEMQRQKAIRKGRPDSRLESICDDDMESVMSYPVREKYTSTATLDDMSLDTILTMPGTPQQGGVEERMRLIKEEMQSQLEQQKVEYQEKLKAAAEAHGEQKLAKEVANHWKKRRFVHMAEAILQNAATLKEAQIMSNEMEKQVVFQFTIVDEGHERLSNYDLVLNGIESGDDEFLDITPKPCVGIRVMDFMNGVVHLWSLQKLQTRVRQMRQIYQYLDRPEYLQHFRLDDPFSEPILPQYSLIGDADVPLTAVFESRIQDFTLDVTSPFTSSVIGIVKLSLKPSEIISTHSSTLKFNVEIQGLVGFAEREGTNVHAQLFIPGISDESGATTTQMVSGFDEGPVKFESVHNMGIPLNNPARDATLRVSMFAKITIMHLEKLISWDDMRDHTHSPQRRKKSARIPETEFYIEDRHDVFARVQVLELAETGEYLPVEVLQQNDVDPGAFQLHQGLQRRIQISLTHSSGDALQWRNISDVKVSSIRLLDPRGKTPDMSTDKEITLHPSQHPTIQVNPDGTSSVTVIAQWDSSLHNSLLLDRTTASNYRVQMSVGWSVTSERVSEPIMFSMDTALQIQPRIVRSPSKLMQYWTNVRIVHAVVGLFVLVIRPAAARRAGDLWRMNTLQRYVKGEEYLGGWTPRGVSLVRDYLTTRKRKIRIAEVENAKGFLSSRPIINRQSVNGNRVESTQETCQHGSSLEAPSPEGSTTNDGVPAEDAPGGAAEGSALEGPHSEVPESYEQQILKKCLSLWSSWKDPSEAILVQQNYEPPQNGACFAEQTDAEPPHLIADVRHVPRSDTILKAGYLLIPDESNKYWQKRYFELRRPYMHVYSVPEGEQVMAINLSNCRIDHQPQVQKILRRANQGTSGR